MPYPFISTTCQFCSFSGDIITVTQPLDGGWWEGTLHGKTGWFPSNYVTPAPSPTATASHRSPAATSSPTALPTVEECQMNGHGGVENGDGGGGDDDDGKSASSSPQQQQQQQQQQQSLDSTPAHVMKDFPTRWEKEYQTKM